MRIVEAQLVRAVDELQKEGVITGATLARALGQFIRQHQLGRRAGKILRALDTYGQTESDVTVITATSARILSSMEQKRIEVSAARLLGKEECQVAIEFHVDPTVIGGVRLETSDTRYDATVARNLRELSASLI